MHAGMGQVDQCILHLQQTLSHHIDKLHSARQRMTGMDPNNVNDSSSSAQHTPGDTTNDTSFVPTAFAISPSTVALCANEF
jgi:hypothetical protein